MIFLVIITLFSLFLATWFYFVASRIKERYYRFMVGIMSDYSRMSKDEIIKRIDENFQIEFEFAVDKQ